MKVRYLPATGVASLMVVVALWTLSRPIEDVAASVAGFLIMSVLALALIPCLHLAIDS